MDDKIVQHLATRYTVICDVNIDECLDSMICDGIPDSTCQDSMGSYDCVCITSAVLVVLQEQLLEQLSP
jgi:hypothetical protein